MRGSGRSGVETSGSYSTTMSDRSRQSNKSGSDDGSENMSENMSQGSSKQRDYYKNYEYGKKSEDSQNSVDSAKNAQAPGKILNRDRLDVECKESATEGNTTVGTMGSGCTPTGS